MLAGGRHPTARLWRYCVGKPLIVPGPEIPENHDKLLILLYFRRGSRAGQGTGFQIPARYGAAHALVAQLDRASDFESEGREFESLRARQN